MSEGRNDPVLVNYRRRIRETDGAVLYGLGSGFAGRDVWVPKSILVDEDVVALAFCVPRWWADNEDLDHDG